MLCPECKTELKPFTNRCSCGWSKKAVEDDWPYDRCRIEDGTGRRCLFPATLYPNAAKRNGGVCRLHYGAPGVAIVGIIEESEKWHAARKAGRDVPLEYTRHDGRVVPGYASTEQLDRKRSAEATAACAKLGLDTPEKIRKYAVSKAGEIRSKRYLGGERVATREPGSDD